MSKIRTSSLIALLPSFGGVAQGQEQSDPADEAGFSSSQCLSPRSRRRLTTAHRKLTTDPPRRTSVLEHQRFIQLLEDRNYDEADIAAKRIIEMAIQVYGPVSHETAKALNNLGFVQNNNQQFDAAAQNFSSAIEILETLGDRLNASLINP